MTGKTSSLRQEQGRRAAVLRTIADPGDGVGAVAQMIHADEYRGKTVRFRASLEGVEEEASVVLWLRVDRSDKQLGIANEPDPPLQGRFESRRVEAGLPVASDATGIGFGVVLYGEGGVRISDARFEVVGDEGSTHAPWPKGPDDLDFSRG